MLSRDDPPLTDFGRYRFLREEGGVLAELPLSQPSERVFLALDCHGYRLCRLHVFESAAAGREETAARFFEEMDALQGLANPVLASLLDHGRDDSELYQVVALDDGEDLASYLEHAGPLPEAVAAGFVHSLLDLAEAPGNRLACLENFNLARLQVASAHGGGVRLRFTDYSGWQRPLEPEPEILARRLALGFYGLMAGRWFLSPPGELFYSEADQASRPVRELIRAGLAGSAAEFAAGLREVAGSCPDAGTEPPLPRGCLSRWLGKGTSELNSAAREPSPPDRDRVQLFPGWDSIPRESWMPQHRASLRKRAAPLPGLLRVRSLESRGRTLLIHEDTVEAMSAAEIAERLGPLPLDHALSLAGKVDAALNAIERDVGSAPVWWLEPRNVLLVTGGCSAAALATAMGLHGPKLWQRFPVRLRLHQTALDLAEGPNLPPAVLVRLHAGGKQDAPARRTAALLPLLWTLLTGGRLDWSRPLECPAGWPPAVADALENARAQLAGTPARFHCPLLRRLEQCIRPSSLVPTVPRLGFVAGEEPGLVNRELPAGASRPLAALGRRWTVSQPSGDAEIVSLGLIEDSILAEATDPPPISALPARSRFERLADALFRGKPRDSAASVRAARAGALAREGEIPAEAEDSAAGRWPDRLFRRNRPQPARREEEEDASVWTPPSASPAPAPELRLVERHAVLDLPPSEENGAEEVSPGRGAATGDRAVQGALRAYPQAQPNPNRRGAEDDEGKLSFYDFLVSASVSTPERGETGSQDPEADENEAAARAASSPALAAIRSLSRAAGRIAGAGVILWALAYWLVSLAGSGESEAGGTPLETGEKLAPPAWRAEG